MPLTLSEALAASVLDGGLQSMTFARRTDGRFDAAVRFIGEEYFRVTVADSPEEAFVQVLECRAWWPLMVAIQAAIDVRK